MVTGATDVIQDMPELNKAQEDKSSAVAGATLAATTFADDPRLAALEQQLDEITMGTSFEVEQPVEEQPETTGSMDNDAFDFNLNVLDDEPEEDNQSITALPPELEFDSEPELEQRNTDDLEVDLHGLTDEWNQLEETEESQKPAIDEQVNPAPADLEFDITPDAMAFNETDALGSGETLNDNETLGGDQPPSSDETLGGNQPPSSDEMLGGDQHPSSDEMLGGDQHPSSDETLGGDQHPSSDEMLGGDQPPSSDEMLGGDQHPSSDETLGGNQPPSSDEMLGGDQHPSSDEMLGGDQHPSSDEMLVGDQPPSSDETLGGAPPPPAAMKLWAIRHQTTMRLWARFPL